MNTASALIASPRQGTFRRLEWVLVSFALGVFSLRARNCFCLFPIHAWNDVRLRPSFLVSDGLPLYPGLNGGPITTWMYGPVHPLWFYPVTWFHRAEDVYLAAAAWNIAGYVLCFAAMCLLWPRSPGWPPRSVLLSLCACLMLVPSAYLTFLQADNVSLMCGLLSLVFLARHLETPSATGLWLASFLAASAAFAKAHGLAVVAGEWVGVSILYGTTRAWSLAWRTITSCLLWTFFTLCVSASPTAAWEHLVLIPAHLPWEASFLARTKTLGIDLVLMVMLPALLTFAFHIKKWIGPQHGPAVSVWLFSLPIGLAGAYKIGGSNNSLHGVFYLLPVFLLPAFRNESSASAKRAFRALLIIPLAGLALFHLRNSLINKPAHPVTARLHQAGYLAGGFKDSVWLPWRPLVGYLATGRHDHDEDGLYVRQLTGYFPSRKQIADHLPPRRTLTAIEDPGMNWGVAAAMQPETAKSEVIGDWLIFSISETPARGPDFVPPDP